VYLGDHTRLVAKAGSDCTLVAKLGRQDLPSSIAVGDNVILGWDPAHMQVFPDRD